MTGDDAGVPDDGPRPPANESSASASVPVEDWETRFKYLLADFENFRRRSEREREAVSRQARGSVLRDLLPLLESFRSARAALGRLAPSDPVRQGMELLDREWAKFLKHQGVEPVVEIGQPFRAEEAEAVGEAPVRSDCADGSVAEIVQQGYRYFGGLLRPAKVVVARAPPAPEPTEGSTTSASRGSETP